MTLIEALVYGIIQGLSEFLPISSSGHLALLPHIMKIRDPGVLFDLMMHLGTALAVLGYFREDIKRYLLCLKPSLLDLKQGTPSQWFVRNFVLATGISVVLIVLLMPLAKLARDPIVIVINLSVFGVLLWLADLRNKRRSSFLEAPMEQGIQWKLAGLIGAAQALAIFPGVSRSGITLSLALLLGMRRKEAGHFSFLLSLPIIVAGILKEIPELLHASPEHLIVLLTGVLSSFVVGYLTIHFFLKLIGRIQLVAFTVYRLLLAVVMFVVVL